MFHVVQRSTDGVLKIHTKYQHTCVGFRLECMRMENGSYFSMFERWLHLPFAHHQSPVIRKTFIRSEAH